MAKKDLVAVLNEILGTYHVDFEPIEDVKTYHGEPYGRLSFTAPQGEICQLIYFLGEWYLAAQDSANDDAMKPILKRARQRFEEIEKGTDKETKED
jgi:hypothetical protein